MFCSICGKELDNNVAFCSGCGSKLSTKDEGEHFKEKGYKGQNIKSKRAILVIVSLIIISLIAVFAIKSVNNPKSKIIGRWQNEHDTVEFMKNGQFKAGYYWLNGTYDISGSTIVMNTLILGNETYIFSIDGDTLTLTDKDYDSRKLVFKKIK